MVKDGRFLRSESQQQQKQRAGGRSQGEVADLAANDTLDRSRHKGDRSRSNSTMVTIVSGRTAADSTVPQLLDQQQQEQPQRVRASSLPPSSPTATKAGAAHGRTPRRAPSPLCQGSGYSAAATAAAAAAVAAHGGDAGRMGLAILGGEHDIPSPYRGRYQHLNTGGNNGRRSPRQAAVITGEGRGGWEPVDISSLPLPPPRAANASNSRTTAAAVTAVGVVPRTDAGGGKEGKGGGEVALASPSTRLIDSSKLPTENSDASVSATAAAATAAASGSGISERDRKSSSRGGDVLVNGAKSDVRAGSGKAAVVGAKDEGEKKRGEEEEGGAGKRKGGRDGVPPLKRRGSSVWSFKRRSGEDEEPGAERRAFEEAVAAAEGHVSTLGGRWAGGRGHQLKFSFVN